MWAHCCIADGELSEEEDEITHELMGYLSTDESLFPEEIANQEAVLEELTYTFNNALPMKTIIQFGKRDGEIARNFYEEACLVFVADGVIASEERKFLEHLAQEWDISPMDQKLIEEQYLERLANGKAD